MMTDSGKHRPTSLLDTEPQEPHRRTWDARRQAFRALHEKGCFVIPNPWDVGSARYLQHLGARFVNIVFSLNEPAKVERLFQNAGFRDVAVRTESKSLGLPPARDFLWQYVHCTPLAGMLSQMDSNQAAALEHDVLHGWQRWSNDGGMRYEQGMIVATARK